MTTFAVLGAGLMGTAAVHHLARVPGVREVRVLDRDGRRARAVAERHGAGVARAIEADLSDDGSLRPHLDGVDAALTAASYRLNLGITRACIAAGVHLCDLGGNNDVVRQQHALAPEAAAAGVAIVPDCGLAPGLVSILAARVLELQPDTDAIHIRVGGIPLRPANPLGYQVVFSVEGLVNEYREPTWVLREGQVVAVPTLGDVEALDFPPPFGRMEAFNTSGGASTLPWTLQDRVRNLDYKTVRWPGHVEKVAAMFSLGLADEAPVEADGVHVRPRAVLERLLERNLQGDGPDVVLLRVEGTGPSGRVSFRLVDRADPATGLTAMMRCTAFPAAVVAELLASGAVAARGTLRQELEIPPGPFVERLRARGLDLVREA